MVLSSSPVCLSAGKDHAELCIGKGDRCVVSLDRLTGQFWIEVDLFFFSGQGLRRRLGQCFEVVVGNLGDFDFVDRVKVKVFLGAT